MGHDQAAEGSDGNLRTGCGVWLQPVTTADGTCSSATPCCNAAIQVPLADLEVVGEVDCRCPTCNKRWDLRYDPWTPGPDALWID